MRARKKYRLKMTEEAQRIVEQLSLEEKIYLMSGSLECRRISSFTQWKRWQRRACHDFAI